MKNYVEDTCFGNTDVLQVDNKALDANRLPKIIIRRRARADIIEKRKTRSVIAIPNNAIRTLSFEALGLYGCILTRIQCEGAVFKNKKDLVEKALTWGPDSYETLEKALNELIEQGYIIVANDRLYITYGTDCKEGENSGYNKKEF